MEDEPEPQPLDGFFMGAFSDLSTCRHDAGPIPWRDIMVYGKDYVGMEGSTLRSFIRVMREMDDTYLEWHNNKTKAAKKPKKSGPPPRTPRKRVRKR